MRAVVQRVSEAGVTVEGRVTGAIGKGLLVLVGIGHDDTRKPRGPWPPRSPDSVSSRMLRAR